jgi:DNA-directed RNA polymerase specialized sigma24 family protein
MVHIPMYRCLTMIKLNASEVAQVQQSVTRAVARMVRRYPVLRTSADDIGQDAWIKFLGMFDASLGHAPGALAYTVATTVAIDYARNRKGKLRRADAAVSFDAPIKTGKDDASATLADLLASALDDAATTVGADARARAVQGAIAALSDAQRDAIEAWLAGQTMTGSQRIAKKRAIEQIQESVSSAL